MSDDRHDVTIRIPRRVLRILGFGALALVLVGAGVGAGLAAASGGESTPAAAAGTTRRTAAAPEVTTTTVAPAPAESAGGSGSARSGGAGSGGHSGGGDAGNGGGEVAGQDVAPPPPPPPAALLTISATPLPANCGTPVPTLSVRWSTLGATSMEVALGGGGFGPAPLNGSRLYPLPCAGGVSVCGRATNAAGAVTVRCTDASF